MASPSPTDKAPETNTGVVTSWIPITTQWPSEPICSSLLWQYAQTIIAGWDPGYGVYVDSDKTCLPKAVTTWWMADHLGSNAQTVVSLGPVTCPEAYSTATQSVKDASSTFVACCPSNYDFAFIRSAGMTGECTSKVEAGSVLTYVVRDESQNWKTTSSLIETASTVHGIQVNGWNFAEPTATASNASQNCSASAQLSGGAVAGIGVGVSLGVTGLAALAAGLFMMFKARKARSPTPPRPTESLLQNIPLSRDHSPSFYPGSQGQMVGMTGAYEHRLYEFPSHATSSTSRLTQSSYPPIEMNRTPSPRLPSEQSAGRTMEMEGEFERNIKVSLPASMMPWSRNTTSAAGSSGGHYSRVE